MTRYLAWLAFLSVALASCGDNPQPPPPNGAATANAAAPSAPIGDTVRVRLDTEAGPILLELDHRHAPVTTENFIAYVDQHRFDNTVFYRSSHAPHDAAHGFIQGGIRHNYRLLLPPIPLEPTSRTGLRHLDGTISMARTTPDSAMGDFVISIGAQPGDGCGPERARRPSRLCHVRPGRRGDGRSPPHPRHGDRSARRQRQHARRDAEPARPDHQRAPRGLAASRRRRARRGRPLRPWDIMPEERRSCVPSLSSPLWLGVAAIAAAPAEARINQRQAHQQQRIARGVATGQLTARETYRLERQEGRIAAYDARAAPTAAGSAPASACGSSICRTARAGASTASATTPRAIEVPPRRAAPIYAARRVHPARAERLTGICREDSPGSDAGR